MSRLIALLFLLSVTNGQIQLDGNCNLTNINYEKNLNNSQIVGNWYEIQRLANNFEEGECPSWTLTALTQNNTIIGMDITMQEVVAGKLSIRNGTIQPGNQNFKITFSNGTSFEFVILKTDYKGYAVLYSCQNVGDKKSVMAWNLSRSRTLSNASLAVVQENTDLAKANWTVLSHSEAACKLNNAINVHINPVILLIIGLLITKEI